MKSLYGLGLKETEEIVCARGFPKYRARQILNWLYQKQVTTWQEIKNIPADLLAILKREYALTTFTPAQTQQDSRGATIKFLFQTHDGHLLESVLISQKDRETVCVSTQLGCKIQCVFCASGQGRFYRNLTSGEILEQVIWVARLTKRKITNIVFMGMGEPLDNFDATLQAIQILIEPWGFGFGARRMTVSTSGMAPRILDFVKSMDGRVRLSVSLHSSQEEVRSRLVPMNRRYPLKELVGTLQKVNQDLKREITFEYTLIDGVNDSDAEIRGIVAIARPLRAKINIIPYNPIREFIHPRPSDEKLKRFCQKLEKHGLRVTLRKTEGQDIQAACGQLRHGYISGGAQRTTAND